MYDNGTDPYWAVRSTLAAEADLVSKPYFNETCWGDQDCWAVQKSSCMNDTDCRKEHNRYDECNRHDDCDYYCHDEWDRWDGDCWGYECEDEYLEIDMWAFTGVAMINTWMGVFFSWAYYQSGWLLHDVVWYLSLVFIAPMNLLFTTGFLVVLALENEYIEVLTTMAAI